MNVQQKLKETLQSKSHKFKKGHNRVLLEFNESDCGEISNVRLYDLDDEKKEIAPDKRFNEYPVCKDCGVHPGNGGYGSCNDCQVYRSVVKEKTNEK